MFKIAVVGAGYVGLTTAACLSSLGNEVRCSDIDSLKINKLSNGISPIFERGLDELLLSSLQSGRLQFSSDNKWAVEKADFVFLCLPTPQGMNGEADLSYIELAAKEIGQYLKSGSIVVNKSTVPVGSTSIVESELHRTDVSVVSNPEFLREGSALSDFFNPDRIVIGSRSPEATGMMKKLYDSFSSPIIETDPATAETIKYAANAFLATKISFINSVAAMCEVVGADVRVVSKALGYDSRIGDSFLLPGPGWGGSCFPKDVAAMIKMADDAGYDFSFLKGVVSVNDAQFVRVVDKVKKHLDGSLTGKNVAILGLTFKANTDDLRDSPSLKICDFLLKSGANVSAYDPTVSNEIPGISIFDNAFDACSASHAIILATEWEEFKTLDFAKICVSMTVPLIVDSRNILNPDLMRSLGFVYEGIGHNR